MRIRLIDRSASKGNRSRFIDEAVKYFVREHGRTELKRLLGEGAERRAVRDLAITAEWFDVDKDAWREPRGREGSSGRLRRAPESDPLSR